MKKKLQNKAFCFGRVIFSCLVVLLITHTPTLGQQTNKSFNLKLENATLTQALLEVNRQCGNLVIFKKEETDKERKPITLNLLNINLIDAIEQCLQSTAFTYSREAGKVMIIPVKQTPVTLKGVVVNNKREPIPGATVIVIGTINGAITDSKGTFSVNGLLGQDMEVSYLGYAPFKYSIKGSDNNMIITLETDVLAVEDVVVTGYFTRSKNSYTGNATSFTGSDLRAISSSNVLNTLSMIDPSFKININNDFGSDPNKIPDFQIQGSTNLQNEYSTTPNMPTFILDGFEVTAQKVFDLDPNRVKSITILKDAAATAIYGSRAANGVVVVESIAPAEGEIRVTYLFNSDFEAADLSSYNLMNAAEKLEYERLAGIYNHNYPPAMELLDREYNEKLTLVRRGINTDWIAKPVRSLGFSHKHTAIVEGGSNTFRYALDVNYRGKNGVMIGSKRDNMGIGVKLQYQKNKVKFTNHITFDNTLIANSPYGSFQKYTYINPYYYPYDENGNVIKQLYKSTSTLSKNIYNPMYNSTINTKDVQNLFDFNEKFSLEWDAVEGLKIKANVSIGRAQTEGDIFFPNSHTSFAEMTENIGSYQKNSIKSSSYDINAQATYFKIINKHAINIAAIYNVRENITDSYGFSAYNFPNDNFDHISMSTNFKEGTRPNGNTNIVRLMGVVINGNYGFDNRFFIDFSLRSDASSIFGANKRWGTFYSVGGAWNIHEENFIKESKVVSTLKLRSSIGTTGGQNFNPYQAMMMYTYKDPLIDGNTYDGKIGALAMAYGNPNLKWQLTEKFNVGIDFSLFKNRLSGYFNYYSNTTKDKLIDMTLAPSTGFKSYTENLGNVNNKGVELCLRGTVVKQKNEGLKVDFTFNLVANKNKLVNVNNALSAYNNRQNDNLLANIENNVVNKPVVKYVEGESINTIWANKSLGIDPATGREIFIDLNGRRVNAYNVNNDVAIATTDPIFEGRFGTMITYKGLSFNALFAYSYGGYIYNQTLIDKIENVNPQNNGDKRILYDRWSKPGDLAKFKNIGSTERTEPTSRFIEKDNFLNLSSVSMSYQFDRKLVEKLHIEMLKISAISNELFRSSTVKMERGIMYPFARTFTLNLQVTF